jgi:hypothetical protein
MNSSAIFSAFFLLFFLGLFILIPILAVVMLIKQGGAIKKNMDFLKSQGFSDCPAEEEKVFETFISFENTIFGAVRSSRYQLVKCMVNRAMGAEVYYLRVRKNSSAKGSTRTEENFIFPLKRDEEKPVMIILNPQRLKGLLKRAMTGLLGSDWGDVFTRIDLPIDVPQDKVLAAFGPRGASLYSLIDSGMMRDIARGADEDIVLFMAMGGQACAAMSRTDTLKSVESAWTWTRDMMRS